MKYLLCALLLLTLTPGCGWIKRPVEATYCAKRERLIEPAIYIRELGWGCTNHEKMVIDRNGAHWCVVKTYCERWADHHNYPCVHDAYGDCTPSTK